LADKGVRANLLKGFTMEKIRIEVVVKQPEQQKCCSCKCKAKRPKSQIDSIDLAGEALLYFIAHRFTPTQKKDFWKALKSLLNKHAEEKGCCHE
jgi:hypothetical protein